MAGFFLCLKTLPASQQESVIPLRGTSTGSWSDIQPGGST